MKDFIEISSQLAWIFSFVIAIIWLIFIKPVYNYFKQNIKVVDKSNFKGNNWNIWITKDWNNYFSENLTNITINNNGE